MYEPTTFLKPLLHKAVTSRVVEWPTYDGKLLDRTKFVSASEIGMCARRIKYGKTLPPSEGKAFYWGHAERGHSHEAWIVEQLTHLEAPATWQMIGSDQRSLHDNYQSGTPDGIVRNECGLGVVDFKSIHPNTRLGNLPKSTHIDQIIQNMDLVEHCLDVEVDFGLLAYSDAADYSKVTEFKIERKSPQVGERMLYLEERAETIMTANGPEDLQPEGMYTGDCTYCAFAAQCSGAVAQQHQEKLKNDTAKRTAARIFG